MTAGWEPVRSGKSGATVLHRKGVYRKLGSGAELEAAKLTWLRDRGVPVPQVLTVEADVLEMRAAPGRPAEAAWSGLEGRWVIDAVADTVHSLHALDPTDCPFDRTLAVVVAEARLAGANGSVDLDDLDASREGWTSADLLTALEAALPSHEDLVVTHGDLSLNNILVDPERRSVTLIDVGRAGVADLHVDLAILTRSLRDHWAGGRSDTAERRLLERYGYHPDQRRIELYRLIDEFF